MSLQSEPCSGTAKATAIPGHAPERTPTANQPAWKRFRTEQEIDARGNATRHSTVGSAVVAPDDASSCTQVRAECDAWERRVGMKRTVGWIRYGQDRVYDACR